MRGAISERVGSRVAGPLRVVFLRVAASELVELQHWYAGSEFASISN